MRIVSAALARVSESHGGKPPGGAAGSAGGAAGGLPRILQTGRCESPGGKPRRRRRLRRRRRWGVCRESSNFSRVSVVVLRTTTLTREKSHVTNFFVTCHEFFRDMCRPRGLSPWRRAPPGGGPLLGSQSLSSHPNILVTGSWDTTVKLWDLSTCTCFSTMTGHSRVVNSIDWNNDGTKLASGSTDGTVKVWSVGAAGTFQCQSTLRCSPPGTWDSVTTGWDNTRRKAACVISVNWHDNCIAAGCYDGKIHLLDAAAGEIKSSLMGHTR